MRLIGSVVRSLHTCNTPFSVFFWRNDRALHCDESASQIYYSAVECETNQCRESNARHRTSELGFFGFAYNAVIFPFDFKNKPQSNYALEMNHLSWAIEVTLFAFVTIEGRLHLFHSLGSLNTTAPLRFAD